jgi:hypothetical protein
VLVVAASAAAVAVNAFNGTGASEPLTSPLAAYPGFGHDAVADENRFDGEEQARENMIADCMQRQGFYYAPTQSFYDDGSMTREEAYDVANADPNSQYTAALSPDEWERYSFALAGVPDANDPDTASIGGCIGEAHAAVPGVFAAYNALREPYEAMQRSVAWDSQVVAAKLRWIWCMLSAGFWSATTTTFQAELDDDAWESPTAAVAETEAEATAETTSGADLDAAVVAIFEKARAAGESCAATAGVDAAVQVATIARETTFVDQYRDVLDRFKEQEEG